MYLFQSANTQFYATSTPDDKPGQEVSTKPGKDSIPGDSILHSNVAIVGVSTPVVAEITGACGLFVSLKGHGDRTRLTWSSEPYQWIVRRTGQGTYVITPANGADLFWFDEFGIGNYIEVRSGKEIKSPQNEWVITPP